MKLSSEKFKKGKYKFVYDEDAKKLKVSLKTNGKGYIKINNLIMIHENSIVYFDVITPQLFNIESHFSTEDKFTIDIEEIDKETNITEEIKGNISNLSIESNYAFYNYAGYLPTSHKENVQINQSNKLVVFSLEDVWYETYYIQDNIQVIKGNIMTLKNMFLDYYFKNIIVKEINSEILLVLYSYTNPTQKKCFISYGFENLEKDYFNNKYFFERKDKFINKDFKRMLNYYLESNNCLWIMKNSKAEKFYSNNFDKKFEIKSTIISKIFDYDISCKDIVLNVCFDNNNKFMVDTSLLIIKELLKKDGLANYKFHVAGTGNYKKVLLDILPKKSNLYVYDNYIDNSKLNVLLEFNLKENYACGEYKKHLMIVNESIKLVDVNNENLIVSNDYVSAADKIFKFIRDQKNNLKNPIINEKYDVEDIIKFLNTEEKRIKGKKAESPILSIIIPSYNIQRYLPKCLNSLVYAKNVNLCEIIIVNDGSKDSTLEIAKKYENNYKGIIKVIDKENGGHGSAINIGMKIANGKYFKILDSDDWLDTKNFELLLEKLKKEEADLVLTRVRCEYFNTMDLPLQVDYESLKSDVLYKFEDLVKTNYGINSAILFAASCYKTDKLRDANFKITEKKLYADHEFDAFSVKCIDTVKLYDLDIYMYLIGREGQSVSLSVWSQKYQHHQSAMFKVMEKLEKDKELTNLKKYYAVKFVVKPMLTHQIDSLISMNKEEEIYEMISKVKKYRTSYEILKKEIVITHPLYYDKYMLKKNKKKVKLFNYS